MAHRFRLQLACVALVLSPFAGLAQQPATVIPTLSEKIEVRVVSIDVMVTDKAGKPITGLTRDDFEITENKIPQPIVNFYEARPEASAAIATTAVPSTPGAAEPPAAVATPSTAPRRVVLYIDNLTLTGQQRNLLIAGMKSFIAELRAGDEVMIATFNHLLRIPLPFTDDHARVLATLDALTREAARGESRLQEAVKYQQDIHASSNYQQRLWYAKAYSQMVLNDVQQSAKAVKTLMTNLAGLEGKKILILASEGFPMQPGVEMFAFIDRLGDEVSTRDEIQFRPPPRTPTGPTTGPRDQTPPPPPSTPHPMRTKMPGAGAVANAREFSAEKIIQSIASSANADGVTLYTVHAGALDGGIGAGADRGLQITNSVVMEARANAEMGLKSLAELTGGLASVTSSRHGGFFDAIRRDLDSYYSLGYRPAAGAGERNLRVRMKKGRYLVRARRTNFQKSREQEMSDRVIANLLSKPRGNDLNVTVTTQPAVDTEQGKTRVPVKIHVPMDSLTFLEQSAGGMEGGFDVFVVVADAGGTLSPVVHRMQKVSVAANQMESWKGTSYTYSLDFLMNRDAARVSVAIVDSISNITSYARYER